MKDIKIKRTEKGEEKKQWLEQENTKQYQRNTINEVLAMLLHFTTRHQLLPLKKKQGQDTTRENNVKPNNNKP